MVTVTVRLIQPNTILFAVAFQTTEIVLSLEKNIFKFLYDITSLDAPNSSLEYGIILLVGAINMYSSQTNTISTSGAEQFTPSLLLGFYCKHFPPVLLTTLKMSLIFSYGRRVLSCTSHQEHIIKLAYFFSVFLNKSVAANH